MTDLLQIHTDGVIERYTLGHGEVDLDLLLLLGRVIIHGFFFHWRGDIIDDLNALVAEPLIHVVHFVGGHILFLERVYELAVRQRATVLLALGKQAFYDFGARRLLLLRPLCHNAALLSYLQGFRLKDQCFPVICADARDAAAS